MENESVPRRSRSGTDGFGRSCATLPPWIAHRTAVRRRPYRTGGRSVRRGMRMGGRFAEAARPAVEALLEPGETLLGIVAATHQKTFSGELYAVGVTERRLLLQPVDRRMQAKGPAKVITKDTLVGADVDGAGGGWWTAPAVVLDAAAV